MGKLAISMTASKRVGHAGDHTQRECTKGLATLSHWSNTKLTADNGSRIL